MRGETGQYGFGRAVRTLRQLAATPGSRRFDPLFRRLYALAEFNRESIPPSPGDVRPAFTGSFEELRERLSRLEADGGRGGAGPSLLREKIRIYRHIFSIQMNIPEEEADVFFVDLLRCVSALLEKPDGIAPEFRLLDGLCLGYVDHRCQRMAEHNGAAEKQARCSASAGGRTAENAAVRAATRAALASGARAVAVLAWAQEPVWTSEKLYAGFEQRVEENYTIDAAALEDLSADGKTASVRVDRRLEAVRRIAAQFCRSFVRLGALEKAKQCERLLEGLALGYASRKKRSLVAFERENWQDILDRSPVYDEV